MARARNLKPGLFTNDDLAENNCPLGRLLFMGLWCLADYKGDLEWRPSRIKVQVLPYDDCDISSLAINLDKSGFVTFYSDGEKIYLRVNNFEKHQNPHPNEKRKGSDIPAYSDEMRQLIDLERLIINRDKSRQKSDKSISDHADSLIPHPDSLTLNPDPLCDSPEPEGSGPEIENSSDLVEPEERPMPVITIPTNKHNTSGEQYPVTEDQIIEWQKVYPSVDVMQVLNRIRSWNISNPTKRKTMRGMAAHIDKWLAREQDRGGPSEKHQQPAFRNYAERQADLTDAVTNYERATNF